MKPLGIGVRVWVGWCPDENVSQSVEVEGRCRTGTISGGPWLFGYQDGEPWRPDGYGWDVDLDGGGGIMAREYLLTPIDDDGDAVHEDQSEAVSA